MVRKVRVWSWQKGCSSSDSLFTTMLSRKAAQTRSTLQVDGLQQQKTMSGSTPVSPEQKSESAVDKGLNNSGHFQMESHGLVWWIPLCWGCSLFRDNLPYVNSPDCCRCCNDVVNSYRNILDSAACLCILPWFNQSKQSQGPRHTRTTKAPDSLPVAYLLLSLKN